MKNILIVILLFCTFSTKAQTLPNFDLIKLEKPADYKLAEPFALQTATYLMSVPFKKNDTDQQNSLKFLGRWMYGTSDYSFVFNDVANKIGKDNTDAISIYMVAMAKYTLEHKSTSKDSKAIKLNALTMLLDYCEKKENNMRMTKQLKKLAEAKQQGQLEQAMLL